MSCTHLQTGARDWALDAEYTAWLEGMASVDARDRDEAYYQSPTGEKLEAWPKLRTGSEKKRGAPRAVLSVTCPALRGAALASVPSRSSTLLCAGVSYTKVKTELASR